MKLVATVLIVYFFVFEIFTVNYTRGENDYTGQLWYWSAKYCFYACNNRTVTEKN